MTKEDILERLQYLREQQNDAYAQYQALTGAIQDCEWFLMRHEQKEQENAEHLSAKG
jgi:hypothetical protein